MNDILRGTKNVAGFHENLEIYMVEISERLKNVQKNTLKNYTDKIKWINDINQLPKSCTIIVANEFLDALPISQYVKHNSAWYERMVRKNNDVLEFCLGEKVKFSEEVDNFHKEAPEGAILELGQSAISIIRYISAKIKNEGGAALFIDYGYDYYGYKDTLQAVKNHKYHSVLQDIGKADMTSHVDFMALYSAAKEQGVKVSNIITQRDFLLSMGIIQRRDMLLRNANMEQISDINIAVSRLIDEDKMGRLFKVLAFSA
jgi:SAM-dependent MidA family methyltransferase